MLPKEIIQKIRRIQITTSRLVTDFLSGQYESVFKGRGMEFDEVREYDVNDDPRDIDWNVTARMGHPFIKKFSEERELTVMLLVDISASNQFGSGTQLKQDLAAELAAVLAFAAIRNNDRVGLILFSDEVEHFLPPKKGSSHVLRVVRDVLGFKAKRHGTALAPALDFLNHISTRKTVTFVISDFLTLEDLKASLRVSAARHDLVAVVTADPRERVWPAAGLVEWRNPETSATQLCDTSDRRVREALTASFDRQRTDLKQRLARTGLDVVEVWAGEAYDRELVRFFKARERRLRT